MNILRAQDAQESGFGKPLMPTNEFEPFCDTVRKLWPHCRFTAEQLHMHWLKICSRHYEPPVVGAALRKCVSESPNVPNWPFIFAQLAKKSPVAERPECEFRKELEWRRSGQESDETIWLRLIDEGKRRFTHTRSFDRTTRQLVFTEKESKPCTNCRRGGSVDCGRTELECAAKRWADSQRVGWRKYLHDRSDPIPAFLADDYKKPEAVDPGAPGPSGTLF